MNNMLQLFVGAWLHPWTTMRMLKEQPRETSIKPFIVYVVVLGFLAGIVTGMSDYFFPNAAFVASGAPRWFAWLSVPGLPILYLVGSLLSSALVWGVVGGFLRGTLAEYKTVYRIMSVPAAYYLVATLFGVIPLEWGWVSTAGDWVYLALNLAATAVLIGGVVIVFDTRVG